jgi:hypothetical protein
VAIERDDVQAFLEAYGRALLTGDVDAVVDSYGRPGLVMAGDAVLAFAERADVEAAFRGVTERYRASGLAGAEPAIEAFTPLGDSVAGVDVVWNTREADGRPGPHERFHYLVRRSAAGLSIHVVVPHAAPEG